MAESAPLERADVLVLFGITGDLAKKMLLPALYRMAESGQLNVPVVGVTTRDWDDEMLRAHAREAVTAAIPDFDEGIFQRLAAKLSIVSGRLTDPATFKQLRNTVHGFGAYYLVVPPTAFLTVARGLAEAGLNRNGRLVVEKPLGHDLTSARELEADLLRYFDNRHLFLVDHFLGQDAVAGLPVFRFANALFAPVWNRSWVDNVQINLVEDFGVADRGAFYDAVGCIRDVIQNHLMQVLAYVTMELPDAEGPEATAQETYRLLRAVRTVEPADTVLGQYEGYQDVPGVRHGSTAETYAAIRLFIDNERWAGVPFYLRSGKCLAATNSEVVVQLRRPTGDFEDVPADLIRLRIEPNTGIVLNLDVQQPDAIRTPVSVPLGVDLADVLGRKRLPYETVLHAAIVGDPRCFASFPAIAESWRIVQNIIDTGTPPIRYAPGSWGPEAARELIAPYQWYDAP